MTIRKKKQALERRIEQLISAECNRFHAETELFITEIEIDTHCEMHLATGEILQVVIGKCRTEVGV